MSSGVKYYIKRLPTTVRVMGFCIWESMIHPARMIVYTGNPIAMPPQAPVPWVVSIIVLFGGIACWVVGEKWNVSGLAEAARAMVYIPLSYMFGKANGLSDAAKLSKKSDGEKKSD